jgi:chaperonin GroES
MFNMFKPLSNRVLVLPAEKEDMINGLYIPDQLKTNPPRGKVEAAGSECKDVKVGDFVYFSEHAGSPLKLNNVEYLIMRETDLFGIE